MYIMYVSTDQLFTNITVYLQHYYFSNSMRYSSVFLVCTVSFMFCKHSSKYKTNLRGIIVTNE